MRVYLLFKRDIGSYEFIDLFEDEVDAQNKAKQLKRESPGTWTHEIIGREVIPPVKSADKTVMEQAKQAEKLKEKKTGGVVEVRTNPVSMEEYEEAIKKYEKVTGKKAPETPASKIDDEKPEGEESF